MAQTAKGQKYNVIKKYTRKIDGKLQTVKGHIRSNPDK